MGQPGNTKADIELDLRGESCPYPSIETKKRLKEMEEGGVLLCIIDRKGKAKRNVVDLTKSEENELVDIERRKDIYRVLIRKR